MDVKSKVITSDIPELTARLCSELKIPIPISKVLTIHIEGQMITVWYDDEAK